MGHDTRFARTLLLSIVVLLAAGARQVGAQAPDENLMIGLPEGWVLGWSGGGDNVFHEYVPEGQSVEAWEDLLTIQIFYGGLGRTPNELAAEMRQRWQTACPTAHVYEERSDVENGYPIAFWQQWCDRVPATGRPEHTILKAIQGTDDMYVIQRAWREMPSDEELVAWSRFLAEVYVCNAKVPGRECP